MLMNFKLYAVTKYMQINIKMYLLEKREKNKQRKENKSKHTQKILFNFFIYEW